MSQVKKMKKSKRRRKRRRRDVAPPQRLKSLTVKLQVASFGATFCTSEANTILVAHGSLVCPEFTK